VPAVDGVGPGTLLAGRYHVQQRVHLGTWSSIWQAVDETLDRSVSLRVVDAGHPRGSDVVDAARRAAGVEDPRLQRVLDVGVEDGLTYVVSEWVGADSLTDLLRSGMPPADEVRRLVGEAATALEAARHRGLHHLVLTPDSLLRGHDGPVTLTGLAVDAALSGLDIADPLEASRRDARALVALIYAGLTGRWPLDPMAGLEPPPRVGSGLPAPSELASGVPADLDALCRSALVGSRYDGPADPGQVATALAPWPAGPVVGPRRTSGAFPISLGPDHAPPTTVIPAVTTSSVQAAVNAPRPSAPPAPPSRPPTTHVPPQLPEREPAARASDPGPVTVGRPGAFPTGPPVVTSTWPPLPVIRPAAEAEAVAAGKPVAPSVGLPTTAGTEIPPAAMTSAVDLGVPPEAESPAPLLPATPTARPPAAQTRAVLAVVGWFVLVLCLLAYCGLRSFGSGSADQKQPTTAQPSASSPGQATTTPGSSTASSATGGSGAAIAIVSATGFDPQGDGSEDNSLAKKAYDSKTSSGWTSDTYRTKSWGGLKKGVGLRLDLGSAKTVSSATLTIGGSGAKIQLLAVTGSSLDGSTVLAQKSNASGTFTLTVAHPAQTRYVVVWFTTPGQFSGGYRAEVDDIRLR
jgi:hypothetical protein